MSKLQKVGLVVTGVAIASLTLLLQFVQVRRLSYHAYRDPIETALNRAVSHLAPGKIAFESPLIMKQSETTTVEVRIARNVNQDITQGLATDRSLRVEDIEVGPLMVASLHGSAFRITPLTKEEQVVTNDNFTAWDWAVHPTDWGKQTLYLNVCVRLLLNNVKEEQRCSPVYNREITVQVDPVYAATHFVKDDPKWTITTLGSVAGAVFGGGGIIAWMMKRRKKQKETVLNP